jgi:hypothetical protein
MAVESTCLSPQGISHSTSMTEPTKIEEADATKPVWQADIRSPSPASSVDDHDSITDGEDEVNGNGKRGKKDRLWFEVSPVTNTIS